MLGISEHEKYCMILFVLPIAYSGVTGYACESLDSLSIIVMKYWFERIDITVVEPFRSDGCWFKNNFIRILTFDRFRMNLRNLELRRF